VQLGGAFVQARAGASQPLPLVADGQQIQGTPGQDGLHGPGQRPPTIEQFRHQVLQGTASDFRVRLDAGLRAGEQDQVSDPKTRPVANRCVVGVHVREQGVRILSLSRDHPGMTERCQPALFGAGRAGERILVLPRRLRPAAFLFGADRISPRDPEAGVIGEHHRRIGRREWSDHRAVSVEPEHGA
jgi:hypothetical protein